MSRLWNTTATNKVDFGSTVPLQANNISFYAWVYPTRNNINNQSMSVISIGSSSADNPTNSTFVCGQYTGANNKLGFFNNNGAYNNYESTGGDYTVNAWNHVGMSYDGTNIRYYLDGVLNDTEACADALATGGTQVLRIGNRRDLAYTHFEGRIAHVGYHRAVLSLGQFKHAMNYGYCPGATLDVYAPVWGHSPEPDLSGNDYPGTVTGTTIANHAPSGRYAHQSHSGAWASAIASSVTSKSFFFRNYVLN